MYTTQDYLHLPPWEALVELVNHTYHLQLNSRTTDLTEFTPLSDGQVSVVLTAKRSTADTNLLPPFTTGTYTYRRLDLATYFGGESITLPDLKTPCNSVGLVEALARHTGIVFAADDFIYKPEAENDYVLVANPHSLRWVGELRVQGEIVSHALADVVVDRSLSGALMGAVMESDRIQGSLYTGPFSFSLFRDALSGMRTGRQTVSPLQLIAILRMVTGDDWECSAEPGPWNIANPDGSGGINYQVVYHDYARPPWSSRRGVNGALRVVVLELSPEHCTNLSGHVLLHYQ